MSVVIDEPRAAPVPQSVALPLGDYRTKEGRQRSFRSWPTWTPSSLNPHDMAETGFYYTGEDDRVVCEACGLTVEHWKGKDIPRKVHKDRAPTCRYVAEQCKVERMEEVQLEEDGDDDVDGGNGYDDDDLDDSRNQSSLESDGATGRARFVSNSSSGFSVKERLKRENERLKSMCTNCREQIIETLFLPCRHLVTCEKCAETMTHCLQCHQTILGTVRTYLG